MGIYKGKEIEYICSIEEENSIDEYCCLRSQNKYIVNDKTQFFCTVFLPLVSKKFFSLKNKKKKSSQ